MAVESTHPGGIPDPDAQKVPGLGVVGDVRRALPPALDIRPAGSFAAPQGPFSRPEHIPGTTAVPRRRDIPLPPALIDAHSEPLAIAVSDTPVPEDKAPAASRTDGQPREQGQSPAFHAEPTNPPPATEPPQPETAQPAIVQRDAPRVVATAQEFTGNEETKKGATLAERHPGWPELEIKTDYIIHGTTRCPSFNHRSTLLRSSYLAL